MESPAHFYFVKQELKKHNISYQYLIPGEVKLNADISEARLRQLRLSLFPYGLEVEFDEKSKIILKIKELVDDYLNGNNRSPEMELMEYVDQMLSHNTKYLDSIFKEETGLNIEAYFNSLRIERAVELLVHYNLTITEIAYQLNFNNEEELLFEFNKVTGLMPEHFKNSQPKTPHARGMVVA
jgi:AraC-like DNA-binding protein